MAMMVIMVLLALMVLMMKMVTALPFMRKCHIRYPKGGSPFNNLSKLTYNKVHICHSRIV
jgi:hypothetical protein